MRFFMTDTVKISGVASESFVYSPIDSPGWTPFLTSVSGGIMMRPGNLSVVLVKDKDEYPIGNLVFGVADPTPLTEDRLAAIRSDPLASKTVKFRISCKECDSVLQTYASLDRDAGKQPPDHQWYEDLGSEFRCYCGKSTFPLDMIRKNLHGLLGRDTTDLGQVSFTRLYEDDALRDVASEFVKLLDKDPPEEAVQEHIKANPVLLQQFSPQRIFFKPRILGKYVADIAIVNQKSELLLVEIEKPGKRLLRKDGNMSADAQHAFGQVTDWLYEIDHHRATVLDGLDLKPSEITKVRGVVIMGRDRAHDERALRKLKWRDTGEVGLFTYDDMVASVANLTRTMGDL